MIREQLSSEVKTGQLIKNGENSTQSRGASTVHVSYTLSQKFRYEHFLGY